MPRTHGTATTYRKGCRCTPCGDANRAHKQRWADRTGRQVGGRYPIQRGTRGRGGNTWSTSDCIDEICRVLGTV